MEGVRNVMRWSATTQFGGLVRRSLERISKAFVRAKSDPRLPLNAYVASKVEMHIQSAPAKRKWMDDIGFANRCLPLLIANQWGWFILNDRKIEVIWNGGRGESDLQIIRQVGRESDADFDADRMLAISHFGHGILTWRVPFLFQTPPGYNLYVRGPMNWIKDGASPLDGVIETEWSSATFTMNWKITRKHLPIVFDVDEPICAFFPVPRGCIEQFVPQIMALSQNHDLQRRHVAWKESRAQFLVSATAPDQTGWQKHYFRGTSLLGESFASHQTKVSLREFRDCRTKPPSQVITREL